MDDAKPTMRSLDPRHERVRLRVLERLSQRGEKERGTEDAELWVLVTITRRGQTSCHQMEIALSGSTMRQ